MKAGAANDAQAERLARAAAFLEARGDGLVRARLGALLGQDEAAALRVLLEARRCAAGGFGEGAGESGPTLRGSCDALELLDEAGIRSGALAEAAAGWLGAAQREDGSWRPEGQESDGVLETGRVAGLLARLRCGSPRILSRAEAFLDAAFSPERVESGGWRPILAFALPATNGLLECADEALQWCGRAFEKGVRSGEIGALDALRTLLLCDVRALPAARIDAETLLLSLAAGQGDDGGFGAAGDPAGHRLEATLVVVRALRRYALHGAALPGTPG